MDKFKIEKRKLLYENLEENMKVIKDIFTYENNIDFIIRELHIKSLNVTGVIMYMAGMINTDMIEKQIITPLMDENFDIFIDNNEKNLLNLTDRILHTTSAIKVNDFTTLTKKILSDYVILLLDSFNIAISIASGGPEHRSIDVPQIESVIKGPKEAFIESEEINRSLIRKRLRNENLITESIVIGEEALLQVSVMYVKNIANDELVKKVKKRISEIQVDINLNISILEQHLEERPHSLVPTVLYTERPDRAAAFLQEGHVVLVDNSAGCIILPATFWSFFHSAEDMYQRWPYGNFMRIIRIAAFYIALLAPGLYVAIVNFHVAMIPTDLLLAIGATREMVPFPVIIEVLIMEFSFELVREAGVRIPLTIGPTIGIVGALILGQAAVEASIVSPILVIIVGITGLSSFAIPEISTNYMVRISRFAFIIAGYFSGLFGISLLFTAFIAYLCSIKSFDVPFFAPFTPHYSSSNDTFLRPIVWKQWLRPGHLYPKDSIRMKKPSGRKNNDK